MAKYAKPERTATALTISKREATAQETEFIKQNLGEIKRMVMSYAGIRGHYWKNKQLIEDMVQEAVIAVLKKYRRERNKSDVDISRYRGIIWNACLRVIAGDRTIKTPMFWLKSKEGNKFQSDEFECYDLNDFTEYPVDSFEEEMTTAFLVETLLNAMGNRERFVLEKIGDGFTPTEIYQMFGVQRSTTYHYLNKAKKYLIRIGYNRVPLAA